jgi:hypothetical protein
MIDILQTCRAVLSITSSPARVATCADLIVIFSSFDLLILDGSILKRSGATSR